MSTKTTSSLYLPREASSQASAAGQDSLDTHLDRTLQGVEDFARREPWAFAAYVFSAGFFLGWKLKIW